MSIGQKLVTSLAKIIPVPDILNASDIEDLRSKLEEQDLVHAGEIETYIRELIRTKDLANELNAKKKHITRIYQITFGWFAFVAVVVIANGLKWFTLDSKIVVTLVGSTTVNLLWSFHHVTKYLLSKSADIPAPKTKEKNKKLHPQPS